jgi:hypothetical protein
MVKLNYQSTDELFDQIKASLPIKITVKVKIFNVINEYAKIA